MIASAAFRHAAAFHSLFAERCTRAPPSRLHFASGGQPNKKPRQAEACRGRYAPHDAGAIWARGLAPPHNLRRPRIITRHNGAVLHFWAERQTSGNCQNKPSRQAVRMRLDGSAMVRGCRVRITLVVPALGRRFYRCPKPIAKTVAGNASSSLRGVRAISVLRRDLVHSGLASLITKKRRLSTEARVPHILC